MIRAILGVVLGYVAMFVVIFITLSISYFALGTEGVFRPNSYQVTPLWMILMAVFAFVAAVIAGKVCRIVSAGRLAVIPLAALVLVLGMTSAVGMLLSSDVARTGEISMWEAMGSAQQPAWAALLLPVLCAVGVIMGGRQQKK